MVRMIRNYDLEKGRKHNVKSILVLTKFLEEGWHLRSGVEHWGTVFAFDALIGNTDRHQDNWGVLWYPVDRSWVAQFAPAFDNGTALGHEILEDRVLNFVSDRLDRYVMRGTHHVRWAEGDARRCGHFELVKRLCDLKPSVRSIVLRSLDFDLGEVEEEVMRMCEVPVAIPLSQARARFILRLLEQRKMKLRETLGL
jgi:hypothetical protein